MLKINADRLQQRLLELAQIGATEAGGVDRPALTELDRQATALVASWASAAGLQVRQDAGGNLFARLAGRRDGPRILTGSHLDTVPDGGRYDGAAGVLCSLEVLETLAEAGITPDLPIELCIFVGEEGSRFAGGLLGSSLLGGQFDPKELELTDEQGITLKEALSAFGGNPERLHECQAQPGDLKAYLEVHIEQGRVLENAGLPLGIVTAIAGIVQLRVTLTGRAEHAGATPMGLRHDPLAGAAEVMLKAEEVAINAGSSSRVTVGSITARPGGTNVIPGQVTFSLDIRDTDADQRARVVEAIQAAIAEVCQRRGLRQEIQVLTETPPVVLPEGLVNLLAETAQEEGLTPKLLPSGAAHDGMNLAHLCPVGMIFLRSRDGLSHNPAEFTTAEDLAAGANLLLKSVVKLAMASV